jgi:hypothetical protein
MTHQTLIASLGRLARRNVQSSPWIMSQRIMSGNRTSSRPPERRPTGFDKLDFIFASGSA